MVGIFPPPKEIYSPMIKVGKLILVLLVCIGCKTTKPVPYTTHPMIIKDTITVYIEHIHFDNFYCVPPDTFHIVVVDTLLLDIYK